MNKRRKWPWIMAAIIIGGGYLYVSWAVDTIDSLTERSLRLWDKQVALIDQTNLSDSCVRAKAEAQKLKEIHNNWWLERLANSRDAIVTLATDAKQCANQRK